MLAHIAGKRGWIRRHRMRELLRHSHVIHHDYAGRLSVETSLAMTGVSMQEDFDEPLPDPWVCFFAACDNNKSCQKLILAMPPKLRPCHLFKSLLEKLPDAEVQKIEGMRPDENASKEDQRVAYETMRQYLEKHAHKLFKRAKRSPTCLIHKGRQCPLNWEDPPPDPQGPYRALTSNWAGTTCTGWTPLGELRKDCDKAMEAFRLWTVGQSSLGLDFVFIENSECFEKSLFGLGSKYRIVGLKLSPHLMGYPLLRMRFYGCGINQDSIVWVGPTDDDGCEKEFMEIFGAITALEADVFVNADDPMSRRLFISQLAKNRGFKVGGDQVDDLSIEKLMAPGTLQRYKDYQEVQASGNNTAMGGCFVADISQHASRMRCGSWLPSLTCSSVMASLSKNHIFSPNEMDVAMGWPIVRHGQMVAAYDKYYKRCVGGKYDGLTLGCRQRLVGNSMHLAVVSAFWLYIMSNCLRRESLERYIPQPNPKPFVYNLQNPGQPLASSGGSGSSAHHAELGKRNASAAGLNVKDWGVIAVEDSDEDMPPTPETTWVKCEYVKVEKKQW
jgi:hypothetical protein